MGIGLVRTLVYDLGDFVYPRLCYVCDASLPRGMERKCPACERALRVTDMHLLRENAVTQRLAGRLDLMFGSAMYRFYKGGRVQKLVHRWKYGGFREIGVYLGEEYGELLHGNPALADLRGIIPVPAHPRKLKMRGYNQALGFAEGLSNAMGAPVLDRWIVRSKHAVSQTMKGRVDRIRDLMDSFMWNPSFNLRLEPMHLMIVDDLLTTGATIEAVAQPLLQMPGIRLSLATVGIGQK